MKIIDNALDHESFIKIRNFMMNECDWYFSDTIVSESGKQFPYSYFIHNIYQKYEDHTLHCSNSYQLLLPVLKILDPLAIVRIKANMYVNQNVFVEHETHIDSSREEVKSAILYINTNNGKTIFLDGTEIESVENRLIIFNANVPHRSTNCTDDFRRININFNYV